MERWQIAFAICLLIGLIGIVFLMVSISLSVFYEDKEIGDSVYFNGSDNVECHSVRIDRNDFLDSYYYKEECKIVESKR